MGFDHVPRAWWDDETICFMLFIVFLFIFAIEIVERKVSVVIRRLSGNINDCNCKELFCTSANSITISWKRCFYIASTSKNILLESFDFVNRRYSKFGWNNCEHSNVPVPLFLAIFMNELDYDYGKAEGRKQAQKDIPTCRLILALSACLHSKSKSDKCKFADLSCSLLLLLLHFVPQSELGWSHNQITRVLEAICLRKVYFHKVELTEFE